ncbi:MAG: hypothetical protein AAFQ43_01105 [Bacteroidota bacterium]
MTRLLVLLLAGLTAALVFLPACDTGTPEAITFQGVEIEVVGNASAEIDGGRLVVTGIGASGDDGIGIWQNQTRTDLKFEPIDLQAGERFGISVRDAADDYVASIRSDGRTDGRHDIIFDVESTFGIQAATLQYLLEGRVIVEIPDVPLFRGKVLTAETNAGEGDGDNGSLRVVRNGGRWVVGQDYSDEGGALTDGDTAARGCRYAIVTLPVPVGDVTEVCTDLVQVVIESETLPGDIRGTAITGRGIGSFVMTQAEVVSGGDR